MFRRLFLPAALASALLVAALPAWAQAVNSGDAATKADIGVAANINNSNCAWAYALKLPCVLHQSGVTVSNTGIGTSEVNLASVSFPALAANDSLRVIALWDTAGTATNTKSVFVRLATSGCTPGATCSTGSAALNLTLNSAALISAQTLTAIRNTGATDAQVFQKAGNIGIGTANSTHDTAAVQTNAGGFINLDCATTTSSADTCSLIGYTIELVPGG